MAWFVPALMAASTAMTIMGHRQNIKNMKANAAWKRYENELQLQHDKQKLFKKQAKLLSEKRARTAASGIRFSGSPLITAKADYDEFENDLMFLEKGVFVKNASMNAELTGMIASETYKMGATLLQSGVNYKTYEMNRKLAEKGIT
tara:strand:- start:876 stop:1313 length:438 start_codon:yes stop_codon:yes gene_type:complete